MERNSFTNNIEFKVRMLTYTDASNVSTFLRKLGGHANVTTAALVIEGEPRQLLDTFEYIKTLSKSYEIVGMNEQWIGTPIEVEEMLTKIMREEKLKDLNI